jgi:mannose/cellobiose epimerase-like protein (N-acyl-D-glucosamine 2-epimerase family)
MAKEPTEREQLENEKIELAKKLGIWDKDEPVDNFRETEDFKRIQEINAKLTLLVKG